MWNRLITADNSQTYTFTSTPRIFCDDGGGSCLSNAELDDGLAHDLVVALQAAMNHLGPRGLGEYLDDELKSIVTSIVVSLDGHLVRTTAKATRELTSAELVSLNRYVAKQFTSGFGEAFGSREFAERPAAYEYEEEDFEGNVTVNHGDAVDQYFCELFTDSSEVDFSPTRG